MRKYRIFKAVKILVMVVVAITAFGFVTMELWNWLVPAVFGLKMITFAQALGLLVLSKILFGGFHRHGCGGRGWNRGWRGNWEERWAKMTPEEQQRFRAGMRGRRGCGWDTPSEPASEQGAS